MRRRCDASPIPHAALRLIGTLDEAEEKALLLPIASFCETEAAPDRAKKNAFPSY